MPRATRCPRGRTEPSGKESAPTTTRLEVVRPDLPPNLAIQRLPSGRVQLTAPSWTNAFVLESNPGLALPGPWTPVWTNPANDVLRFEEPLAAMSVRRFYRAVRP